MLRNYIVTALRNLERNRLYAAIIILGLAVAFTAAILIAEFVRNEFSYDRWIPGYQSVYRVADITLQPGQGALRSDLATPGIARRLRQIPDVISAAARIYEAPGASLRRRPGAPSLSERAFAWADPDIFKVFPLPVLAGNLQSALQEPDTMVITRRMAQKYFGRDLPMGETMQVQAIEPQPEGYPYPPNDKLPWHTLRVVAVLADLPPNTNLTSEMFASGSSAYSTLKFFDRVRPGMLGTSTFIRVAPKATPASIQHALDQAGKPDLALYVTTGSKFWFHAVPLSQLHFSQADLAPAVVKPVGSQANAFAIAAVGAVIVLVAAINFVTLLTARAARRGMEVGVRKAAGAARADLMVQFVGEAMIQVALSAVIATALAEASIRPFSAFTQRELTLDWVHDPALVAGIAGAAIGVGLLAAIYPALVLSSFRPATVLKGGPVQMAGSAGARQALVVVQFAVLVGLIVTTATLYRQTEFALARGFGGGADSDRIVRVAADCDKAFIEEVRRQVAGAAVACSSLNALNTPNAKNGTQVEAGRGKKEIFDIAPVDFGFLELYGLKPLAGRLFSADHGEDAVLADPKSPRQPTVVLNETAAHRMGFSDARDAVGHSLTWFNWADPKHPQEKPSEIIGVVPDMPLNVRTATEPFMYYVAPDRLNMISIKLTDRDIPGSVRAIARAWTKAGHTTPIQEKFASQARISLYLDLIIQSATIGICAVLAILIACLGLFALSAYTTERRTKEIGVRKAMGARTFDVVLLLVWQFTIPVLIATAIAIPIGFLGMGWWLHGFAYHVGLSGWTFLLAAVAAVGIAWLTVSYQSFMVARANPVSALRYE